jgi:hypothetical protein
MRNHILSFLKEEFTLKRHTGMSADMKRTTVTVGTFKGKKEDRSRLAISDEGIAAVEGCITIFCVNDLNAGEGDVVEFSDGSNHTIIKIKQCEDRDGVRFAELIL